MGGGIGVTDKQKMCIISGKKGYLGLKLTKINTKYVHNCAV